MRFRLRRLSRKEVYKGSLLTFCEDEMKLPDGKRARWDFVSHPTGGACVVAVLPDGRVLMERQYRPAVDRETLELPAGAKNAADEDPMETARRELEEETGYTADSLLFLLHLDTAPSWCNECTDVYLARNVRRIAEGRHLDEAEEIGLTAFEPEELEKMIYTGKITDSKTIAGILAFLRVKDRVL